MQRHHLRDGLSEQSHDCFLLSPDDSNIIVERYVCDPWSDVCWPCHPHVDDADPPGRFFENCVGISPLDLSFAL